MKTIAEKLGFKTGKYCLAIGIPSVVQAAIQQFPVDSYPDKQDYPVILLAVHHQQELREAVPTIASLITAENHTWILYPKQSSQTQSDLNRDICWAIVKEMGFTFRSLIAIDEIWSAALIRPAEEKKEIPEIFQIPWIPFEGNPKLIQIDSKFVKEYNLRHQCSVEVSVGMMKSHAFLFPEYQDFLIEIQQDRFLDLYEEEQEIELTVKVLKDRKLRLPDDLRELFSTPSLKQKFLALSNSRQRELLYFLEDAKKSETREKRLLKIAETLHSGS